MDGVIKGRREFRINTCIHVWMDGRMYRLMDGWMDGWMVAWDNSKMDEYIKRLKTLLLHTTSHTYVFCRHKLCIKHTHLDTWPGKANQHT